MRPEMLFPLFADVKTLDGVGPKVAQALSRLVGGPHVVDLLWHVPTALVDRRFAPKVAEAPAGRVCTITVRVSTHQPPPRGNRRVPYKVLCRDDTGFLTLVYFHAKGDYLMRLLPPEEVRVVSGKIEHYGSEIQMPHPDHVVPPEDRGQVLRVEPVYPMTAGLGAKTLGKAIAKALDAAPEDMPEWLDPTLKARHDWPDWHEGVHRVHAPEGDGDLSAMSPARQRLAYDELLANQLALAIVRRTMRKLHGRAFKGDGRLRAKVAATLPFALTGAQERALAEIGADMAVPERMLRLLQGDVDVLYL